MSNDFKVICDRCGKREKVEYNGEHWLPRDGWMRLWDIRSARVVEGFDMCVACARDAKTPLERCADEEKP